MMHALTTTDPKRSSQHRAKTIRPALALGATGGLVLVVLVGLLIRAAGDGPTGVDQVWHDILAGVQNSFATLVALTLNTVGGTFSMTIVLVAIAVALLLFGRWRDALVVAAGGIGATLASEGLKVLIDRPRPVDALTAAGGGSYPSGHTTVAAFVAIALALAVRRVWVWVAAGVWIVLMAWSRTYLLVHWLTDTVAGAVLGASVAILSTWLVYRWWPVRHEILR